MQQQQPHRGGSGRPPPLLPHYVLPKIGRHPAAGPHARREEPPGANWTLHWLRFAEQVDYLRMQQESTLQQHHSPSGFPSIRPNSIASMDAIIELLLSFPPQGGEDIDAAWYDKVARGHISKLARVFRDSHQMLLQNAIVQHMFEVLNPAVQTISYIILIDHVYHAKEIGNPQRGFSIVQLRANLLDFIVRFDPIQARFVGPTILNYFEMALDGKIWPMPIAIPAITTALLRLDPTNEVFTPTYSALVARALEFNCHDEVMPVLSVPPRSLPAAGREYHVHQQHHALSLPSLAPGYFMNHMVGLARPLSPLVILEGWLHSAMIMCARRDWVRARDLLRHAVIYPASGDRIVSEVMVQAYKKWLLCGLLIAGQVPPVPVECAAGASLVYYASAKPYHALGALFASDNDTAAALKKEAEKHRQVWARDRNEGLVGEVLDAYQKWQVAKLKDDYITISVGRIRERTKSARTGERLANDIEMTDLIVSMIESKMVRARLTMGHESDNPGQQARQQPAQVMLDFSDQTNHAAETTAEAAAAQTHDDIMQALHAISASEDRMGANRDPPSEAGGHAAENRDRTLQLGGRGPSNAGAAGAGGDEDLMTGIDFSDSV